MHRLPLAVRPLRWPAAIAVAALAAACAADLAEAELRVAQQAHANCFEFDESGNPPVGDDDEDGFCNDEDTCPFIANDQSADADGDGRGDRCDACFGEDTLGDGDLDGFCADTDCDDGDKDVYPDAPELCDGVVNACGATLPEDEEDADGDGVPNCADLCEGADGFGDRDDDGLCGDIDPCEGLDNVDADEDGVCDSLDACEGDDRRGDADGDGVCADLDVCEGDDTSGDADDDGVCDDRDLCFGAAAEDTDLDGVCDDLDLCEGDDALGDMDADGWCADLDCADDRASDNPDGEERCDGRDNDCSSVADDGALCGADEACVAGACTPLQPCYRDVDGDGFAGADDVLLFAPGWDCAGEGRLPVAEDCDDDPAACGADCAPNLDERCDAEDHDCDGDPRNDPEALCEDPVGGEALCAPEGCVARCDPGWSALGATCVDIDECVEAPAAVGCDPRARCVNEPGTARCECPDGTADDADPPGTRCVSICGDGLLLEDEACDDGGREGGDGCDADCQVEPGWLCDPACEAVCGDGLLRGAEACDDGNDAPRDGCDACEVETDWRCEGEPSVCARTAICGDGVVEGAEACDDGNLFDEDGCARDCSVEAGYTCTGEPSACALEGADAGFDAGADAGAETLDGPGSAGSGGCATATGSPALATIFLILLACVRRPFTPRVSS